MDDYKTIPQIIKENEDRALSEQNYRRLVKAYLKLFNQEPGIIQDGRKFVFNKTEEEYFLGLETLRYNCPDIALMEKKYMKMLIENNNDELMTLTENDCHKAMLSLLFHAIAKEQKQSGVFNWEGAGDRRQFDNRITTGSKMINFIQGIFASTENVILIIGYYYMLKSAIDDGYYANESPEDVELLNLCINKFDKVINNIFNSFDELKSIYDEYFGDLE